MGKIILKALAKAKTDSLPACLIVNFDLGHCIFLYSNKY